MRPHRCQWGCARRALRREQVQALALSEAEGFWVSSPPPFPPPCLCSPQRYHHYSSSPGRRCGPRDHPATPSWLLILSAYSAVAQCVGRARRRSQLDPRPIRTPDLCPPARGRLMLGALPGAGKGAPPSRLKPPKRANGASPGAPYSCVLVRASGDKIPDCRQTLRGVGVLLGVVSTWRP